MIEIENDVFVVHKDDDDYKARRINNLLVRTGRGYQDYEAKYREKYKDFLDVSFDDDRGMLDYLLVDDGYRVLLGYHSSLLVTAFYNLVYRNQIPDRLLPRHFFRTRLMDCLFVERRQEKPPPKEGEKKQKVDYFGFDGPMVFCNINDDLLCYAREMRMIKTKEELIAKYRNWMLAFCTPTPVEMQTYTNPFEFYLTADSQFGKYYDVLYKLKKQIGDRLVIIPGDGVGMGSIICTCLGLNYLSSEPNEIGSLACALGIISNQNSGVTRRKDSVIFLANMSDYLKLDTYIDEDYIILDENRLFPGYREKDIKWSSHGYVHTNLPCSDDFVCFGKAVSNALPMVRDRKNVPLSSKAEFFLLENALAVYTDGIVETCTKPIEGGDHYIDTKSYVSNQKKVKKNRYDYLDLDIVTKNRPYNLRQGKVGNVKIINGQPYTCGSETVHVSENRVRTIDIPDYRSRRVLEKWEYRDDVLLGYTPFPLAIRCLFEGETKRDVLYSYTLDKKINLHVFRELLDYMPTQKEVLFKEV